MVIAYPQNGLRCRFLNKYPSDIGRAWQKVFYKLVVLQIKARYLVRRHRACPHIVIAILNGIVGRRIRSWN